MSFQQLQKFNFFPHYVEDNHHPSKVVQSTPFVLTYAFIVAMIILIITEITLFYKTTEFKTEVESIADSETPFFLTLTCDDEDGCLLDLLKKDAFPDECREEFPVTMSYNENKDIRLCRIADPGAALLIAIHESQNLILEGVEELDEGEDGYEAQTYLWNEEGDDKSGNTRTFTFTPYMEVNELEGEIEQRFVFDQTLIRMSRWLFEENTEVVSFNYLLSEGFGCTNDECFCGNETIGFTCNILLMRLNDYFIETKTTRSGSLFETLSLIGGFGGLMMTAFRFVNRAVYTFSSKKTLVKVESL